MKKVSLKNKIVLLFIFVISTSLIIVSIFMVISVINSQRMQLKEKITNVAKIVSANPDLENEIKKSKPSSNSKLENYTMRLQKQTGVDFIVILNQNLTRYTHPDKKSIGYKFSSPADAEKSLHGKAHYSTKKGVLGISYRYFYPIYDSERKQIGIVCVGMTLNNINNALFKAELPILLAFIISLIIGITVALFLSFNIRKELLDMEPGEIARKVTELTTIMQSMSDGIVAIDSKQFVMEINILAQDIFPQVHIGTKIEGNFYRSIFSDKNIGKNQIIVISSKEFYVSSCHLISEGKKVGKIALFRDQSEYIKIENQLKGTNQYVESLRAQQHEFLNKLQAVSGLIELKQYEDAQKFISTTEHAFYEEFGSINTQIQMPAVAGFVMGKIKEGKERGVQLELSSESRLNVAISSTELSTQLIKIIGNLVDNSFDATENIAGNKKIIISLNYDEESQIIIIEVEDSGKGIPENYKKKILQEKFSTKGFNRGFGLNLVKQIVDYHSGFIEISNNNPKGTIVYIELPL
ncbi:ATP-binding protein [Liquorilactobacillus hordei]|uniref:ATP-binding protein n=1 Tax=Liquorilactobacillus hordei TaxID=468911 RepID=UPI0039EB7E17